MAPPIAGDLRIVMLGVTGAGKSATGNTILGKEMFEVDFSPESITKQSKREDKRKGNRSICIIDTPGLKDTSPNETENKVKAEINKCMKISAPGPHVFLLVIRVDDRLTDEKQNAVEWIQENFGKEAARHTIILLTYVDQLKSKSLHEHIEESPNLVKLVRTCGGRYNGFNNEDKNNQAQVNELLDKMDELVIRNEGKPYSTEMFNEAQRRLNSWKSGITVGIVCGVLALAGIAALKN